MFSEKNIPAKRSLSNKGLRETFPRGPPLQDSLRSGWMLSWPEWSPHPTPASKGGPQGIFHLPTRPRNVLQEDRIQSSTQNGFLEGVDSLPRWSHTRADWGQGEQGGTQSLDRQSLLGRAFLPQPLRKARPPFCLHGEGCSRRLLLAFLLRGAWSIRGAARQAPVTALAHTLPAVGG